MKQETYLRQRKIKGLAIGDGIAIGRLLFLKEKTQTEFPEISIHLSDVENEIERYRKALRSSRIDLEEIQVSLAKEGSIEAVTIIDSHIRMLEVPFMTTLMEDKIRKMLLNTESVFQTAISDYEKQFTRTQDSFFRQRLIDVQDLSQRVLHHLYHLNPIDLKKIEKESILIAKEFCPSHIAEAPPQLVRGLIASLGSSTSHAGLIARAKGLPFLIHIDEDALKEHEGKWAIIDSNENLLLVDPDQETLDYYYEKIQQEKVLLDSISDNLPRQCETKDGKKLKVLANLDSLADFPLLQKYQVEGVGLFRSEFLLFEGDKHSFTEEEQFKIYSKLIQESNGIELVFRVFDFGGDKKFHLEFENEINPALGLRSIRLLLRYRDLFKTQLRALFRAAAGKKISLLLPFIADVEEVLEAKKIIFQSLQELSVHLDLKIGAMIEMPSAVILCEQIARHVDFLSVGTNDLIQYTLVFDRQSSTMQDVFKSTHPSIIVMLKMIIDASRKTNVPVCLCGEMASNPLFASLLIGLGFTAISCSMRYIPKIKSTVAKIDSKESKTLTDKVLSLSTATEIHRVLTDYYCQIHF